MRTNHSARWLLAASLAVNALLLGGILYLKVPAIHELVLPLWKAVRGISPAQEGAGLGASLREGQITLAVAEDKSAVSVTLPRLEHGTYVVVLDSGAEMQLRPGGTDFTWTLHDSGSGSVPNAATVWTTRAAGLRTKLGELEIHRVSEDEGWESLGAERENGWLFVGRCTFEIVSSPRTALTVRESGVLAGLTADERSRIASLFCDSSVWRRDAKGIEGLVANLGRVSSYLCSCGLKYISPTNNERLYAELPSAALLAVLRREIGVQCQGFRSVFVWVVLSCGWLAVDDIREVDAFRYDAVPGIVVNSHALLEIQYLNGKWLAFDPTASVVFVDKSGRYVSAEELAVLRRMGDLEDINVVHLSEPCVTGDGAYDAGGTFWQVVDFDDKDPFNYNYWCVFNRLGIRTLSLPE